MLDQHIDIHYIHYCKHLLSFIPHPRFSAIAVLLIYVTTDAQIWIVITAAFIWLVAYQTSRCTNSLHGYPVLHVSYQTCRFGYLLQWRVGCIQKDRLYGNPENLQWKICSQTLQCPITIQGFPSLYSKQWTPKQIQPMLL